MRKSFRFVVFALALALLGLVACSKSPTQPSVATITFQAGELVYDRIGLEQPDKRNAPASICFSEETNANAVQCWDRVLPPGPNSDR